MLSMIQRKRHKVKERRRKHVARRMREAQSTKNIDGGYFILEPVNLTQENTCYYHVTLLLSEINVFFGSLEIDLISYRTPHSFSFLGVSNSGAQFFLALGS